MTASSSSIRVNVGSGDNNHHTEVQPFREEYEAYRPRTTRHWNEARHIVLDIVRSTQPVSWPVAQAMLITAYRFVVWAHDVAGVPFDAEKLFTERNIKRYAQQRSNGRMTPLERADLRFLARMVEARTGERPATTNLDRSVPRPYTRSELAATVSFARTRRTPRLSTTAYNIIALGAGAGLTNKEMENLRSSDILADSVLVRGVSGSMRRAPILPEWRSHIQSMAGCGSDHVLFAGRPRVATRRGRSIVSDFLNELETGRPDTNRLRATWIAALLARGCGPLELLEAAGFDTFHGLEKFRPWMPKASMDDLISKLDAHTTAEATR